MHMSPTAVLTLISAIMGAAGAFITARGTYGYETLSVGPFAEAVLPDNAGKSERNRRRETLQKTGLYFILVAFVLQGISAFVPSST
jgi:hypothetical protein